MRAVGGFLLGVGAAVAAFVILRTSPEEKAIWGERLIWAHRHPYVDAEGKVKWPQPEDAPF